MRQISHKPLRAEGQKKNKKEKIMKQAPPVSFTSAFNRWLVLSLSQLPRLTHQMSCCFGYVPKDPNDALLLDRCQEK